MSSTAEYFEYISEQLSAVDGVSYRKMMGEYIIYVDGKIVGGIYDDRLLIKPTASANRLMPNAASELPYDGAKPMLLVDFTDDKERLSALIYAVASEVPEKKKRK